MYFELLMLILSTTVGGGGGGVQIDYKNYFYLFSSPVLVYWPCFQAIGQSDYFSTIRIAANCNEAGSWFEVRRWSESQTSVTYVK